MGYYYYYYITIIIILISESIYFITVSYESNIGVSCLLKISSAINCPQRSKVGNVPGNSFFHISLLDFIEGDIHSEEV